MIYFHISRYRTFKDYYIKHVCQHLRSEFPGLVSYSRFVELMQGAMVPLMVYLQRCRLKKSTGIAFVNSTTLKACHNRRIHNHKTFQGIAQRGLRLITKIRKNMDNKLMALVDKMMLKKRALIESINDQLKNLCQIEHTRHRSAINFLGNLFSGLIAYTFSPQKPSITTEGFALLNVCF